ncbi:MAG: hypothetical protein RLY16_343, partial [Bacteroidota bacterium]
MNRKGFLQTAVTMAGGSLLASTPTKLLANPPFAMSELGIKIPEYLKPGDRIGICSPAGYITLDELQPALQRIEEWGFTTKIGDSIGQRDFCFGGTDEVRAADLQQLLDATDIKAILCARGGYGLVRIIDHLDFTLFQKNPKWLIGFSDITVLHEHLNQRIHVASIHSKMCNSFVKDRSTETAEQRRSIESIRDCLLGKKMEYQAMPSLDNRLGISSGQLIGGNLKTIESTCGSKSDIQTAGKILFVEDTGEYLYSIDRMFWNLKRSGKLDKLAGLIIGGFKIKPDAP